MKRLLVYITLSICLLASCHSSKKVVTMNNERQYEVTALYDSIQKHYGNFSTVSFKFALDSKELLKKIPVQVKGTVRIKKDSIIWISIAPTMNIEMFRCVITQDSLKFYSKLQKTYYEGSIDSLTENTKLIDFQTLQAIFLDQIFFCNQTNTVDTLTLLKSFEVDIKNNISVMKAHSKKEYKKNDTLSLQQIWTIDNENFRISEIEIMQDDVEEKDKMRLKMTYSEFEDFQNIQFPTKVEIKAKKPNTKFNVDMEYSKIQFNEDLNFPFNPSDKYQKIDLKN